MYWPPAPRASVDAIEAVRPWRRHALIAKEKPTNHKRETHGDARAPAGVRACQLLVQDYEHGELKRGEDQAYIEAAYDVAKQIVTSYEKRAAVGQSDNPVEEFHRSTEEVTP